MTRTALPLATCLLLATGIAGAADATDTGNWNGSLDAGYTAIAGNSESSTLTAAATGKRTDGRWTHHLEARGKNTEESGVRSGESYRLAGKEDWAINDRSYLFLAVGWDKDRFSGYEWQLTAAGGYGYKLINRERQHLSVEAGPGYRHDELPPPDDNEDSGSFYAAADYDLQITDNTKFTQALRADVGEDDTITRSLSELAVKMNSRLALKASLEVKRHSDPPAGTKNSDRTTSVALAWTF